MADINRVTLVGRLTRDAELKYTTSGGTPVCRFSIAVNRYRKGDDGRGIEEASFFDIVVWGRQGEAIKQYLVKGKQVAVDGELRQGRWEQDGQQRSKVEIIAQNVQLLGGNQGAPSSSNAGYTQQRPSYQPQPGGSGQAPQSSEQYGYSGQGARMDEDFPDDVPF